MSGRRPLVIGVSLDGAGAHPGAGLLAGTNDRRLDADRLVRLAQTAERGGLDFVALDDSFEPAASPGTPGMDAVLALARVAPLTSSIGLLATVTTTHTEPFHISKNVATLDLVSGGRGAWRVAVSTSDEAARLFGRKDPQPFAELIDEAEDAVDVVRRLWDSWEDDAVIRDRPTGRYIDRDKVHYVDFEGRFFSVRGPSITPRSPQGQPLVAIDAGTREGATFAGRHGDIAIVDATDIESARQIRDDVRAAAAIAGRDPDDVTVIVAARLGEAGLRAELDSRQTSMSSGLDLVGSAENVALQMEAWYNSGATDGFLLSPDTMPATLEWLVDDVVAPLRDRGVVAAAHRGTTLRDHFGLGRPSNRYAAVGGGS